MNSKKTTNLRGWAGILVAALILSGVSAPGAGTGNENDSSPFLLSFFRDNGQHGVYLAHSDDGYRFHQLNEGKPVFRPPAWPDANLTRDPSILYHDGLFYMVWTTHWHGRTFGYATSPDLVTWSEPVQVTPFPHDLPEPDQPGNVWAPEIHWDPVQENFLILFSSTTPREKNDGDSPIVHDLDHRTYAVRKSGDKFGSARLFLDRNVSLIDPVLGFDEAGQRWVMIIKHELTPELGGKNFRLAFAPADLASPFPPAFSELSDPILGPGSPIRPREWIEGPSLIRDGDTWRLYGDAYRDGHYSMITSTDFEAWHDETSALEVPAGTRHGTVFRAPRAAIGWLNP